MTNHINATCDKCSISSKCQKYGSSPLLVESKQYPCKIWGGYSRRPVDENILSEISKEKSISDGPCVSFIDVPVEAIGKGKSIHIVYTTIKVFHDPVLSAREKNVPVLITDILPKSNN